ncbi:predicted protein [Nematostella vectensis]|uniref:Large ribosomal subunit protein eL36 n=1 Tax=Nematostella vectensis TaxID=45351 RepID=A7TBW5_NEMVE|nr:predicted protein [Nematostella vectensis]|eukprot:XP_001618588.1 hypothetical protein NEMVEDRAFT_v1g224986 [Nematostella vectensis]
MPPKPRFRRNDRGEVILQQIRAAAKDKQRNKDAAKPTSGKHPHETGKPWGTVNLDPEQPDDLTAEEEDDMDDEGFLEMDVPTLLAPCALATAPSVSEVPASTVSSSSPLRRSPGPSGTISASTSGSPRTLNQDSPPSPSQAESDGGDDEDVVVNMAPKVEMAVGLQKGHKVTKNVTKPKPSRRKGKEEIENNGIIGCGIGTLIFQNLC